MFISKVIDAGGEAGETEVWLAFSKDAEYLDKKNFKELIAGYNEVNRMWFGMIDKHEKFCR